MLVLSRRKGEAIYIGDDVIVRIAEVRGDKVRLAIQAPEAVLVDREEVRERRREFEPVAGAISFRELSWNERPAL